MPRMSIRIGSLLLLLLWAGLFARPAAAEPAWERVISADGIDVTMREVPGRGFPTYRGVGVIESNFWDVLAVISDVPRHKEWNAHTADARMLQKRSDFEYIVYSRTDVPWPLDDRDAVFHSTVHVNRKRGIIDVRFEAMESPLMPPVKGVVRMTKLRGHYQLTSLGPQRTLMDLQVDADPGGWVPKWMAKLGTKKLPLDSIRNMRRQVQRTRRWYNDRIRRWQAIYDKL